MRSRDPEKKRRLLLEAALEEFAAYGVAGARIDRLAKRAGISAGLVYSFYDNKDGLFEAVYEWIVEQTVNTIPIDADDLGEYAGRLYDAGQSRPEVLRLIAWYHLERGDPDARRASTTAAMADKVAAIADAQARGIVTDRLAPGEILALVLALSGMWQVREPEFLDLVEPSRRRAVVVDTLRRLTSPANPERTGAAPHEPGTPLPAAST